MKRSNEEDNMGSGVWQTQTLDVPRISVEYVRYLVEKFNAEVRRERYLLYVASIIIAAGTAVLLFVPPRVPLPGLLLPVVRLGACLATLGTVYVVFQVRRRRKLLEAGEAENVAESLSVYRAELRRRLAYVREAWRWSLWPLVPGVAVILGGGMLYDPRPGRSIVYGVTLLLTGFWFLFTLWSYHRQARKFQRELDAIATL